MIYKLIKLPKLIIEKIGLYTIIKKLLVSKYAPDVFRFMIKDYSLFEDVNFKEERDKAVSFFSDIIKDGDLVFDVGANYGQRANIFNLCGGKVVSFEPQKDCIKFLKWKFKDKITIIEKGVGSKDGKVKIYFENIGDAGATLLSDLREGMSKFYEIEITTLDKMISTFGTPKFCKIDVEGYELEVLKGLNSSIPFLSIEYLVATNFIHTSNNPMLQTAECCERLVAINPNYKFNYSPGDSLKFANNEFLFWEDFKEVLLSEEFKNKTLSHSIYGFGDVYARLD